MRLLVWRRDSNQHPSVKGPIDNIAIDNRVCLPVHHTRTSQPPSE